MNDRPIAIEIVYKSIASVPQCWLRLVAVTSLMCVRVSVPLTYDPLASVYHHNVLSILLVLLLSLTLSSHSQSSRTSIVTADNSI